MIWFCTLPLCCVANDEDVPQVEFMYFVFTRMPGESYRRRLRSLLLYLCYVFRALINSLVCWFCALYFRYAPARCCCCCCCFVISLYHYRFISQRRNPRGLVLVWMLKTEQSRAAVIQCWQCVWCLVNHRGVKWSIYIHSTLQLEKVVFFHSIYICPGRFQCLSLETYTAVLQWLKKWDCL